MQPLIVSTNLSSPFESALISKLAYLNPLELRPSQDPNTPDENYEAYVSLINKGWVLKDIIHEYDYYGYIWINEKTKQIVISHRGSQNITSWITDIESVIERKSGQFTKSAIGLLSHPLVLAYRNKGYRLKSVGHSLAGFLAQLLVFWSQRQEFEKTYYPEMSADVFDSPGIVDFIDDINSNIKNEKDKINPSSLNIHNYCAMPTLVSTYGTQTGTLWHLSGAENEKFAYVNDHRMVHILKGFDPITGHPKDFRQMADWPQADYSHYESVTSIAEYFAGEGIKIPFTFLNYLYKKFIKRNSSDTWYDQIFRKDGQVEVFLHESSYRPNNLQLEEKIFLALKAHYVFKSVKESTTKISLVHFEPAVQAFLSDIYAARKFGLDNLGLEAKLRNYYGQSGYELISKFSLNIQGNKVELILSDDYQGNIFTFQNDLHYLFRYKEILSIRKLYGERVSELDKEIKNVIDRQSAETKLLQDQMKVLEANFEKVKTESETYLHCAISKKSGANAFVFLSQSYSLRYAKEDLDKAKPGFKTFIECAIATEPDADAAIIPADATDSQIAIMERMGFFKRGEKGLPHAVLSAGVPTSSDANFRKEGDPTVLTLKK